MATFLRYYIAGLLVEISNGLFSDISPVDLAMHCQFNEFAAKRIVLRHNFGFELFFEFVIHIRDFIFLDQSHNKHDDNQQENNKQQTQWDEDKSCS